MKMTIHFQRNTLQCNVHMFTRQFILRGRFYITTKIIATYGNIIKISTRVT